MALLDQLFRVDMNCDRSLRRRGVSSAADSDTPAPAPPDVVTAAAARSYADPEPTRETGANDDADRSAPLRFKFMPTPTCPLHVGHAWLLFVMDALARAARARGRAAEIVLVLDALMGKSQGYEPERLAWGCAEIVSDIDRLGIELAAVVRNDRYPPPVDGDEADVDGAHLIDIASVAAPGTAPSAFALLCAPRYYLRNAMLDTALGITHVLRGADQIHFAGLYVNLYAALGVAAPSLAYLPLVRDGDGRRIEWGMEPFRVSEICLRLPADDLLCLLTRYCMTRDADVPPPADAAEARRIILGEDWEFALGGELAAARKAAFLARFVATPQVPADITRHVRPVAARDSEEGAAHMAAPERMLRIEMNPDAQDRWRDADFALSTDPDWRQAAPGDVVTFCSERSCEQPDPGLQFPATLAGQIQTWAASESPADTHPAVRAMVGNAGCELTYRHIHGRGAKRNVDAMLRWAYRAFALLGDRLVLAPMDFDLIHDVMTGGRLLAWSAKRAVPLLVFCGYRFLFDADAFEHISTVSRSYPFESFGNPYRFPFDEVSDALRASGACVWTGAGYVEGIRQGAVEKAGKFGFSGVVTAKAAWAVGAGVPAAEGVGAGAS